MSDSMIRRNIEATEKWRWYMRQAWDIRPPSHVLNTIPPHAPLPQKTREQHYAEALAAIMEYEEKIHAEV